VWSAFRIVAVTLLLCGSDVHAQEVSIPRELTYEEFMALPAEHRRQSFSHAMSAENKASIVNTHAGRWLKRNSARLSSTERAIFQEMIDFIMPELYRTPASPQITKEEQALRSKMRCRVDPNDVVQAFGIFRAAGDRPVAPRWTYLTRTRCWLEWAVERVM
jgi:hypothetical protein